MGFTNPVARFARIRILLHSARRHPNRPSRHADEVPRTIRHGTAGDTPSAFQRNYWCPLILSVRGL
ncbi:hypothetical protein RB9167 [Rhodopirellula baltica SH 1]|uniref:Uncharacterized protein n=1 Tax=Rhodopirellula baltica (strain DSM 10527 / NCIMB 13988 / SH1) TaxID=243090 RepID=Q7ULZ8_RHOBA|nr:hypothetical protein RB9167 [Rhodopirellula baltica SH 1]